MLNRKNWKTCLKLANAIFDYIEIFCGQQRQHSSLKYLAPVEYALLSARGPLFLPETHHPRWKLSGWIHNFVGGHAACRFRSWWSSRSRCWRRSAVV
ncbi:IS3 family transposase [Rhodococcus wratislaviensis]|uniref:IS3 family transposase n=1 Tax=Rhodococcus wratislaviensis TaxID=44752 RepID=UPI003663B87A